MKKFSLSGIKAIIFDMDGTMIDNNMFHKKAFKEFCRRHGYNLTDEEFRKKLSGKKNTQILTEMFEGRLTEEEIRQYSEEKEALYRELYDPHFTPVEGLHTLIQKFQEKKIRLAIATTAYERNRIYALEKLGFMDTFEVIVGDEHVTHGKPNPEIYFLAAKKLGIRPENCLVFEDSPAGIEAAKRAGMNVIGILTTHTEEELKNADEVIKNFSELDV